MQYAIADKDHNKVEALEAYGKETGNITRNEALEIFQSKAIKDAQQVFVGLESKKNTLIPISLFNSEKSLEYINELFTLEQEETVATQPIKPVGCQSIFTLKKGTERLLNSEIEHCHIMHAPSALLIAYQQMVPPNKEFVSFVRLQQDEILITIFRDKQLQLHKAYSIENLNDAYFYYMDALNQLDADKNKMMLSIFGSHKDVDQFKNTLDSNIETVKYLNRLPTLQYTDEIFSHPAHHFFNLFALLLCA